MLNYASHWEIARSPAKAPKWPLSDIGGRGVENSRSYWTSNICVCVYIYINQLKYASCESSSFVSLYTTLFEGIYFYF